MKRRRRELGLSLRGLARQTDLTASFLSQVERGQANTSIESLRRIAEALHVPLMYFLANGSSQSAKADSNSPRFSPVVRTDCRRKLILPDSRIIYEMLVPDLSGKMEAFCGHLVPGAGNVARRLREPTEEFIFVLSGCLKVALDDGEYFLDSGDSIYFPGATLTELSCASDKEVAWISVITPPVF
jgi:transcriptional regulator with XRE-family HTH domain